MGGVWALVLLHPVGKVMGAHEVNTGEYPYTLVSDQSLRVEKKETSQLGNVPSLKILLFQVTGRMMMPSTFSCRCYDRRWGGEQHSAGPF